MQPATVRRALLTAAVVGSILVAINHGEALASGRIDSARAVRILLTVAVPYAVSTASSVSTRLELARAATRDSGAVTNDADERLNGVRTNERGDAS